METVEIECFIHIVVAVGEVILPVFVRRIDKIYVALPVGRQLMAVAFRVILVGIYIPMVAHSISLCVVKSTETEIVEHCLHAQRVCLGNVVLHHRSVVVAVGNVLVALKQIAWCAAERPMLLVLPIVELQSVNVAAVEKRQFGSNNIRSAVATV